MVGIYQLVNKDTGERYIGQSENLNHRKACHKYDLQNNRHRNHKLQSAYNKNPDSISFEILCVCEKEDLDSLEKYYIKKYKRQGVVYNITEGGRKGFAQAEESIKKMSEAKKGNKSMNGIKLTEEWKKHLSEAQPHKKKIVCIETEEEYESFADAARKTGLNRTKIVSCCTGKRKTTGGYHFRYADEKTSD